ncbi:MAG: hypothetical protein CMF69_09970 [Magnetovibrio sp.]|nr:hypothetical protein [Magnetovibrio sp.]
MIQDLRNAIFASRIYSLTLGKDLSTPWPSAPIIWSIPLSQIVTENSFEWLIQLSSTDNPISISDAQNHLSNWLAKNHLWHAESWRPESISDRLTFSLTYFDVLCKNAPKGFKDEFTRSLNRQARHLFRVLSYARKHGDMFRISRGALFATLYMKPFRKHLHNTIIGLLKDLPRNIYSDGGQLSRQPHLHLESLGILIHIREVLAVANIKQPESLQDTIERMVSMLRTYLHKDGGLALFNGSSESSSDKTNQVLELTHSRAKAVASARHSGFFRITAQRSLILFDVGTPVSSPLNAGHAGTLSFEFSVNRHRLIVNCGGLPENNYLTESLRSTAAHSTLTVYNTHSSDIRPISGFGTRRAHCFNVRRREDNRNVLVEACHNGYLDLFGLVHHRSIYLANDGLDLRGEDVLKASRKTDYNFDIRFHLHPSIKASLTKGGQSVLLQLPTGRGWRMRVSDYKLSLEESIYVGSGKIESTSQIVISGHHTHQRTAIKWKIAREG